MVDGTRQSPQFPSVQTALVNADVVCTRVLTVTKTGQGTVTSTPAGIDCGATCTASFADGTQVVLSAAPAPGYTFTGWPGGACSGTGTCTLTMSSDRALTANFSEPILSQLQVS